MPDKPSVPPVQYIILDTNIIQYLNDKHIEYQLYLYLLDLIKGGFGFAISDVSVYELLSGVTVKQEEVAISTLSNFRRYIVNTNVLVAASQLSTIYKREKISDQEITLADKLVGATAILTGSLVMTANVNDFPRPFFTEAEEKLFYYKHKNKTCMRVVQILKPNLPVMQQRFSERSKN